MIPVTLSYAKNLSAAQPTTWKYVARLHILKKERELWWKIQVMNKRKGFFCEYLIFTENMGTIKQCWSIIYSLAWRKLNSTKTDRSIHVSPAISWLRFLLLVVPVARRWWVSFLWGVTSLCRRSISWYSFLKLTKQKPDHARQSLFNVFPGDSFTASFQSLPQATVLSFLEPGVYRMYLPGLTINNSTFCPNSVFMCFVWIWEQTAIISLYSINWLVCITEI